MNISLTTFTDFGFTVSIFAVEKDLARDRKNVTNESDDKTQQKQQHLTEWEVKSEAKTTTKIATQSFNHLYDDAQNIHKKNTFVLLFPTKKKKNQPAQNVLVPKSIRSK